MSSIGTVSISVCLGHSQNELQNMESDYEIHNLVTEITETMMHEEMKVEADKYYAVFYQRKFYIGRVLEITDDDSCEITFLFTKMFIFYPIYL